MANGIWFGSVNDSISRGAVKNVRIRVTDPDTDDLLGLYKDREGTLPLGNPFLTREDGAIQFYVRAGRINVNASKGAESVDFLDEIVVDDWTGEPPPTPTDPTNSRLIILNDLTPRLTTWELPGFVNYDTIDGGATTDYYTVAAARDGTKIALGRHASPYWKLLDATLTDITPAVTLANRCFSIAVSLDGNFIAAAHHQTSPYITVMDVADGYSTSQPVSAPAVHPSAQGAIAWNHNASQLAIVGSAAPRIIIYDMPGFDVVSPGPTAYSTDPHNGCVFNEDSTWLACATGFGPGLVVYDTSDWSVIDTALPSNGCVCIAYSEALGLVALGDADGAVYLVETTTWTLVDTDTTFAEGGNGVTSVSFSYDDSMLIATHNFSPFAIAYNMPAFADSGFRTSGSVSLDYAYAGIFVPLP